MTTAEIPILSAQQELPVEYTVLRAFNASLDTLADDQGERVELEAVFARKINEEKDPGFRESLAATANIIRWGFWGNIGDPLPAGLQLDTSETFTTLKAAFPLSQQAYEASRRVLLCEADIESAFPSKPRQAHANSASLDIQRHKMEQQSKSMQFLRELVATEPTTIPVYDAFQDQVRQSVLRDHIRITYNQDVYTRSVDAENSGQWVNAKAAFTRAVFCEESPKKDAQENTYNIEGTARKLEIFLNTIDPGASNIIKDAYDSYLLPNHLNNRVSSKARIAYERLLLTAQKTLDGPFPLPATTATFLRIASTLLMNGRDRAFHHAGPDRALLSRVPTWQLLVDWQLAQCQKEYQPHYGDVLSVGDTMYPGSHATLLSLRQPSLPTQERPHLAIVPIMNPKVAQLVPQDYSPGNKLTHISFLTKEDQEKQDTSVVATVIECVRPSWPQKRRLIQARQRYDDAPALPKQCDDADIAIFVSQPDLVGTDRQPTIIGFDLVAEDRDRNRYYYRYNPARDSYTRDTYYQAEAQRLIASSAQSLGMFDLAVAISEKDQLSAHSLAALLESYSYHGFPDDSLLQAGQALYADAQSLADLQKFVSPQGLYCTQCTGGARLFQLLDTEAHGPRSKAIDGLVWDGGSSVITSASHRQIEIYDHNGSLIIDVSSTPKSRKNFPLKKSTSAYGITLGSSGNQLGLANTSTATVKATVQPRETDLVAGLKQLLGIGASTGDQIPIEHNLVGNPERTVNQDNGHHEQTEILTSERTVNAIDRKIAAVAARKLIGISSQDIMTAINLGEQALYAPHIDITSATKRAEQSMNSHATKTSATALEVLQDHYPQRKKPHMRFQSLIYGRAAIASLVEAANHSSKHDAVVIRRAARILDLLHAVDI